MTAIRTQTKIKILMVSTSYPTNDESVAGIFVKNLVSNLPNNINCTILAPDDDKTLESIPNTILFRYAPKPMQILAQKPGGIPAALNNNKSLYFLLPLFLLSLSLHIFYYSFKNDIIHANWSVLGILCGVTCKILKKPLITTLRGEDLTRTKSSKLFSMLLELSLKLSDQIICVSSSSMVTLKQKYPDYAPKISHIPNGVNTNFTKKSTKKQDTSNKPIQILTVGSLIPRKDISTTVKAFSKIHNKHCCQLNVIGDGPEKEKLIKLSKNLNSEDHIHFLGSRRGEELIQFYHKADIFVLASISEGRPNVLLEAMASGIAIVVSNIEGTRELIDNEKSGLFFEVGDSETLSLHLDKLCETTSLRERLSEAATKKILSEALTWQNCAAKYVAIYKKLTRCFRD